MNKVSTYEFCKLDPIDLRVASWLFAKCPHALLSYLEFIAKNDYQRKGVSLNANKVFDELIEVRETHIDYSILGLPQYIQESKSALKPSFIL